MSDACGTRGCERTSLPPAGDGRGFAPLSAINTLALNEALCLHCGMCSTVCPHGVFAMVERRMQVVNADACMECGACQLNCPAGALFVDSGVGCAAAMISAALRGNSEVTCGGDPGPTETSCGGETSSSSCCG